MFDLRFTVFVVLELPRLSGLSTKTVWIEERTTNACEEHKPEEIIGELREVEIMLGQGGTAAESTMRKPRDFDAELKALEEKARELKISKVQQLGELVIATSADSFTPEELAGALIVLAEKKDPAKQEPPTRTS